MKSNNYNSVYLTLEERVLVNKLRDILDEKGVEYNEDKYNENYLIRFLIAEKYDLEKAYKKFKKYLDWYTKYEVSKIKTSYKYSDLNEVNKYYKTGYHKCDKLGRPIYIEIFEDYPLNDLSKKAATHERLNTFYIQKLERMFNDYFPICSQFYKKYIYQMCIIMDIRNIDFTTLSKDVYQFVELRASYDQSYYPESLGQLIVVNNSKLIQTMWALVSGFIDDKTRKKVLLCNNDDYKEKLLEIIDIDSLPIHFGGKCNCKEGCLNSNEGPWK